MKVDIIGVPVDYGAGRRGVDMGPSAIRYAGLRRGLAALGHQLRDRGDLPVPIQENVPAGDSRMKYLDPVLEINQRLAAETAASVADGAVPLVLGGDHSLSLGSVGGAAGVRRLGVLHLDTHGDFNTPETTPSGNLHGMMLAALCGYGDDALVTLGGTLPRGRRVDPRSVAIVGARELDPGEKALMREAGVTVYSMATIDRYGIRKAMLAAIEVASRDTDGIYLSLDLDVVDPMFAPGVGTPAPGGLTIREAHLAVEMLADTGLMVGMDLVEVNPILDRANMTGELAVELALSAFGKKVWDEEATVPDRVRRV